MTERFFLYLDILGFTELVRRGSDKLDDLYEVIASLNAHDHDAFKVVVFSDTVIVYNVNGGNTTEDAKYLVMFLCEFVRDLMHRLMGREIYFRAIITYGDFTHYELNGMPCFFGNALINAHNSEKELKAIGLFIDKNISHYCDVFNFKEFNENYNFVYVTQALDEIEMFGVRGFPIDSDLIECTDSKWVIIPEIHHIKCMYAGFNNSNYTDLVKEKYQNSWKMYCKHYPCITIQLLSSNQDITSISPNVDWQIVLERHPEDCSYAVKLKKTY